MMRVLVCGGRDFFDYRKVKIALEMLMPIDVVIHGAAAGADSMAAKWATIHDVDVVAFPVTKEEWTSLGRQAGPARNQRMLDEGKPDLVLAFPGGRGTADMVRRACREGVLVLEVR